MSITQRERQQASEKKEGVLRVRAPCKTADVDFNRWLRYAALTQSACVSCCLEMVGPCIAARESKLIGMLLSLTGQAYEHTG